MKDFHIMGEAWRCKTTLGGMLRSIDTKVYFTRVESVDQAGRAPLNGINPREMNSSFE